MTDTKTESLLENDSTNSERLKTQQFIDEQNKASAENLQSANSDLQYALQLERDRSDDASDDKEKKLIAGGATFVGMTTIGSISNLSGPQIILGTFALNNACYDLIKASELRSEEKHGAANIQMASSTIETIGYVGLAAQGLAALPYALGAVAVKDFTYCADTLIHGEARINPSLITKLVANNGGNFVIEGLAEAIYGVPADPVKSMAQTKLEHAKQDRAEFEKGEAIYSSLPPEKRNYIDGLMNEARQRDLKSITRFDAFEIAERKDWKPIPSLAYNQAIAKAQEEQVPVLPVFLSVPAKALPAHSETLEAAIPSR